MSSKWCFGETKILNSMKKSNWFWQLFYQAAKTGEKNQSVWEIDIHGRKFLEYKLNKINNNEIDIWSNVWFDDYRLVLLKINQLALNNREKGFIE